MKSLQIEHLKKIAPERASAFGDFMNWSYLLTGSPDEGTDNGGGRYASKTKDGECLAD